jgi:hypothetical protein
MNTITEQKRLQRVTMEAIRSAEQAAYAWACSCDEGPERNRAFEIYENVRTSTRVPLED